MFCSLHFINVYCFCKHWYPSRLVSVLSPYCAQTALSLTTLDWTKYVQFINKNCVNNNYVFCRSVLALSTKRTKLLASVTTACLTVVTTMNYHGVNGMESLKICWIRRTCMVKFVKFFFNVVRSSYNNWLYHQQMSLVVLIAIDTTW